MSYVICEYEKVKKGFPEFQAVTKAVKTKLLEKATDDWKPLTFGGMYPKSGQFGETPIMPATFRSGTNAVPANTTLPTWNQWINAVGHQVIMSGANGGQIYEDYKVGLVGLAFLDKSIRISEIKMQVSDKKLVRVNIEEAYAYNKPAIVLEDYFVLDEETGFDLYAHVTSLGPQRIKLLGLQLNKVPNKLQVTATGAALV